MSNEYRHGQTTEEHNNIDDIDIYNARVYECVAHYKGGTIVDVFSGGPRDTLKMMKVTGGEGFFVAIDNDPARITDLCNKNYDISKLGKIDFEIPKFEIAKTNTDILYSKQNGNVAVLAYEFPSSKSFQTFPDVLKADFMLCNAGIMFVPPEDLKDTLVEMTDILSWKGELVLRFSQARDDKRQALEEGQYFIHDPEKVKAIIEENGLECYRFPDVIDPQAHLKEERNFHWVDMSVRHAP